MTLDRTTLLLDDEPTTWVLVPVVEADHEASTPYNVHARTQCLLSWYTYLAETQYVTWTLSNGWIPRWYGPRSVLRSDRHPNTLCHTKLKAGKPTPRPKVENRF